MSDAPKIEREKLEEWADEFSDSCYLRGAGGGETRRRWPGLCGHCISFGCVKDEFSNVVKAICKDRNLADGEFGERRMRLSPSRPINACTEYWPIGAPTVRDLLEQARVITVFKERGGYYL